MGYMVSEKKYRGKKRTEAFKAVARNVNRLNVKRHREAF